VKVVSLQDTDFEASGPLVARLKKLGATVRTKYIKTLSHVVLSQAVQVDSNQRARNEDALALVFERVLQVGAEAHIVSPLWVQRSETLGARAEVRRPTHRCVH
jgi:hypothetical protein